MPVRPNMQPLIDYLRREGNASETDSFEGVTYWTDEQLQDILDQTGERLVGTVSVATVDGTIYRLDSPRHIYPDPDTIVLLDEDFAVVADAVTHDFLRNEYTFVSDPEISYVQAVFINMWKAVAELWDNKANQRYGFIDNKSGQNALKSHQEYEHCVERAKYYRSKIIKRWSK